MVEPPECSARGRNVQAPEPHELQPQAEVDVFEVAEEVAVEAAAGVEGAAPVERHGGAGRDDGTRRAAEVADGLAVAAAPGHAGRVVAVADAVEVAAVRKQLGDAEGAAVAVRFGGVDQQAHAVGREQGIGVDGEDVRRRRIERRRGVVAAGEAEVFRRLRDLDGRVGRRDFRETRSGGRFAGVVPHDDRDGRIALRLQRLDAGHQPVAGVPADDDGEDAGWAVGCAQRVLALAMG